MGRSRDAIASKKNYIDFHTCILYTNNVTFVTWYKWNMTIENFLSAYSFLSVLSLPEILFFLF